MASVLLPPVIAERGTLRRVAVKSAFKLMDSRTLFEVAPLVFGQQLNRALEADRLLDVSNAVSANKRPDFGFRRGL